ncbi:AAA family ATPase [Paeniglutamicibacter sp. NPDC012692]|uniref:AAA family ATPase n=1 Tax=Paeniglutamicibacter sp. NPDC012692 TaxID=3364388 RepID=UPI0036876C34
MRVHSLEIEAFGPFAKRATIDFDALSEGGIFLLNGETGAGKTSVLDGICYALYGSLPGVRQGSKSLRSDHAEASVAPEVICEFSTGGRRFEVTRSPAWDRPTKRGKNGTTTAQAQSRLREFVGGSWIEKSTRNDEVGATLGEILGLDKEQFTKVAMLPQGAFAAFLRAKDKDREDLLRSLFDTSEYALTEKVLGERFAEAKAEAEAAERNQRATVEQLVADALTTLYPDETDLPEDAAGLRDSGDFDALGKHFDTTLSDARQKLQQELTDADARSSAARTEETKLKERGARHAQLAELATLRRIHEEQAAEVAELAAKLTRDAAAVALRPYHQQALGAAEATANAESRLHEALASALDSGAGSMEEAQEHSDGDDASAGLFAAAQAPGAELETVVQLAEQAKAMAISAVQKAAVIEAALPDEQELEATRTELGKLETALESESALQSRRVKDIQELKAGLPALQTACATADALLASLPALQQTVDAAGERRDQVAARGRAERAQLKAHSEFNDAKTHTLTLREAAADLVSLRLDQSAATLAAALRDGDACMVCGSHEHPKPATQPEGGLVDSEAIEHAQAQAAKAEAAEAKTAAQLEKANTALALIRDRIGDLDKETAAADFEAASLKHRAAVESSEAATEAAAELAKATAKLESLQSDETKAATAIEVTGTKIAAAESRVGRLTESLAALSGGGQGLRERHAALKARAESLESLAAAASELAAAHGAAAAADAQWEAKLAQAGIADTDAWLGRLLPSAERVSSQQLVDAHNEQSVRIKTLAEAPETTLARSEADSGTGAPEAEELVAAAAAVRESLERRDTVLAGDAVLESYTARLQANRRKLADLAREQGPVLERFNTLKSMSDLARGLGENRLKMTLSTYVLAARLEAVALAATHRLLLMTGQRYSLVHDDTPRGNNKSGLGLQILDSWTGVRRDTQTLSGGESFMASLSLALGLADVIQHQSGGIDIETLFVDEGFGSLDAETLEQVMDALEALRSGGRVIGVVSHVADMKQRITTRLNVHKGRNGSTVSMEVGG